MINMIFLPLGNRRLGGHVGEVVGSASEPTIKNICWTNPRITGSSRLESLNAQCSAAATRHISEKVEEELFDLSILVNSVDCSAIFLF